MGRSQSLGKAARAIETQEFEQRWNVRINILRSRIKDCSHSVTEDYQWMGAYDGYGTQKRMTGKLCLLCGKRNSWPGMSQLWHKL